MNKSSNVFIEVNIIPTMDWNKSLEELEIPQNRRLINVNHIERIHPANDIDRFDNRAEIVLSDSRRYNVIGSYETIITRLMRLGTTISRI
jgi:hypothetical protein